MLEGKRTITQEVPDVTSPASEQARPVPHTARVAFARGRATGSQLVGSRTLYSRAVRPTPQGLLVAEGDSWFDSPGGDLLSALEDFGYQVASSAHGGNTLEDMSFSPRQPSDFHRMLSRVKAAGETPRAVLLGGGGNDIAGEEFSVLLNHASSGLPALNTAILEGIVEGRLKAALAHWIGAVDVVCREVFGLPLKIVIHGYDYPVPDGRGATMGPLRRQGPWLRPGFWMKGHTNLQRNRGVVREIINRLNAMQIALVEELELPNLVHVDLRNTLSSVLYENDWENELQPTEAGFRALARKIAAVI